MPVAPFAIALAVVLLAIALIASQRRRRTFRGIDAIDLSSVAAAMMEKYNWSAERTHAAQEEYRRFLILLQKRPGFMLIPWLDAQGRDDLDQFWHQHILDTAKYASDCQALFGHIIHHNPHIARGSEQENDAAEKTRRLYVRTFQSGPYGCKADAADFSSCSTCAAVYAPAHGHGHSHSHSHSGSGHHGGDSGGHGGHSCGGGHGCGGHGCGGGH